MIGTGRPARKYLKNVISLFADKWCNIGLELFDPEDESKLDEIQSNKGGNVSDCCNEMLRVWLQKQPYATWNQLIEALRSPGVELFDVASKIEEMLNGMRPSYEKWSLFRVIDSKNIYIANVYRCTIDKVYILQKPRKCNFHTLVTSLFSVRNPSGRASFITNLSYVICP